MFHMVFIYIGSKDRKDFCKNKNSSRLSYQYINTKRMKGRFMSAGILVVLSYNFFGEKPILLTLHSVFLKINHMLFIQQCKDTIKTQYTKNLNINFNFHPTIFYFKGTGFFHSTTQSRSHEDFSAELSSQHVFGPAFLFQLPFPLILPYSIILGSYILAITRFFILSYSERKRIIIRTLF